MKKTLISISTHRRRIALYKLLSYNITDRNAVKAHITNIREEHKSDSSRCPKCGGELVLRQSKYGTFYGCSNYPKCKYTK